MSDLISRQAVRLAKVPYDEELSEYERGWNDACDAIADNAESAQPDIVRCGECKWWADVDGLSKSVGFGACCYNGKALRLGFLTTKNWYCADGERKDDE